MIFGQTSIRAFFVNGMVSFKWQHLAADISVLHTGSSIRSSDLFSADLLAYARDRSDNCGTDTVAAGSMDVQSAVGTVSRRVFNEKPVAAGQHSGTLSKLPAEWLLSTRRTWFYSHCCTVSVERVCITGRRSC